MLTTHPEAFPPTPPHALDDAEAITACDWAAFDSLSELNDHWRRPGWTPATRAAYWLISFRDPAFVAQARRCQDALLGLDAFDLIPPDGFHLTLGRIALQRDTTTEQLNEVAARVEAALPRAFDLTALPLTGSRGAIRYSVAPWTPLIDLHQRLTTASAESGLPALKSTSRLRPHIGIGYCRRTIAADCVRTVVSPLRSLPPLRMPVKQIDLVIMRREAAAYRWSVHRSIRLR